MNKEYRAIAITFELDRPFTEEEHTKLCSAVVEAARACMGVDGNLIRWTGVCAPSEKWMVQSANSVIFIRVPE